jgi:hypothetical protein
MHQPSVSYQTKNHFKYINLKDNETTQNNNINNNNNNNNRDSSTTKSKKLEQIINKFDNTKINYKEAEIIKYILMLLQLDKNDLKELNLYFPFIFDDNFIKKIKASKYFDLIFTGYTNDNLITFFNSVKGLKHLRPENYEIAYKYLEKNPEITMKYIYIY